MGRDPEAPTGWADVDWGSVLARIVTGTGWTLNYVLDECDIPTVLLLFDHWEHSPPAAEALANLERMVAAWLGAEQRKTKPVPSPPARVADIRGIPGMAEGKPVRWMSAAEYLRRRDQQEAANGNA